MCVCEGVFMCFAVLLLSLPSSLHTCISVNACGIASSVMQVHTCNGSFGVRIYKPEKLRLVGAFLKCNYLNVFCSVSFVLYLQKPQGQLGLLLI